MHENGVSLNVLMNDKVFSRFAAFDTLVRTRRWMKLLAFFMLMLGLALVNLFTGAPLLFWILLVIGCFSTLSSLFQFGASVKQQTRRFHLEKPKPVYRLSFPMEGDAFTLQITDQEEKSIVWPSLYGAYRTKSAIYLYTEKNQAYIVPFSQLNEGDPQRLWALVANRVSADKRREYAKGFTSARQREANSVR